MTAPSFAAAGPVASAASNAGLTLTCPTGDPTGKMLVAVVSSRAVGASPPAPHGWAGPFGSGHQWLFTKIGVLADSGASVVFPAWTPEIITPRNTGVVLAYNGATAIDVISAVVALPAADWMFAPQVRTGAAESAAVEVWSCVPPDGARSVWAIPASTRVSYGPSTGNDLWLAIADQTLTSPGRTAHLLAEAVVHKQWRAVTFVLRGNAPPNKPTGLLPADGTVVDSTADLRLSWAFSDPDATDSQASYSVLLQNVTASTTVGFTGGSDQFVDIPTGTLIANDSYTWIVQVTDQHGAVSPWSGVTGFIALLPPDAPTITSPAAGAVIAGPTQSVAVSFSGVAAEFEVRILGDVSGAADPSVVLFDQQYSGSGLTGTATFPVTYSAPGTYQHVQARLLTRGLWSGWYDARVHVVFTPPLPPTVALAADDASGSLQIAYSIPAISGAPAPPTTSVDLYVSTDGGVTSTRIATGLTAGVAGDAGTFTWVWWLPVSGVDYSVQAVAVAADGVTNTSGWVSGDVVDDGLLSLVDNGDESVAATASGGASITDNGDGSATVAGADSVITDNSDGSVTVAA